jgi:Coenzyme PQQ synthesis protein D (PqqD)
MRYEKEPRVSVKKVEAEVFAFNRTKGVIHSFNEIGGLIVLLVADGVPLESLVAALVEQYEVDVDTARKDLIVFLRDLREKYLVQLYDE